MDVRARHLFIISCLLWLIPGAGQAQHRFEVGGLVFSVPGGPVNAGVARSARGCAERVP